MQTMPTSHYLTSKGAGIYRAATAADYGTAVSTLARKLNDTPGVLLSSGIEFPGRYSRWDIGFSDPPLRISAVERTMTFEALNQRGEIILAFLNTLFADDSDVGSFDAGVARSHLHIKAPEAVIYEEDRTRQCSVFTVLRTIISAFFEVLQGELQVGCYHSLVADRIPDELQVTAHSEDGEIMAIQHRNLPVSAVQFHPESIMTLQCESGRMLIGNVLRKLDVKNAHNLTGMLPATTRKAG